jgi:hypothetical protein
MSTQNYSGSCHCGAVAYKVDLDATRPVISCNCSICRRAGTLLSFVPATDFTLEKGDDQLIGYQFAKRHIDHLFCKTCGIKSFARGTSPDGTVMIAVNVRCLADLDLEELNVMPYDGAAV